MAGPTPFGKYELLQKVAAGGMAEVWRARLSDGSDGGRIIAVKRILPQIAEDTTFITMFLNEARIVVQLAHPGVVQIHDLGQIGEDYFLAMEYISGKNLRTIHERTRKVWTAAQLQLACYVTARVAEALDYVHAKKGADGKSLDIIHRDVTPENVLVSYDGQVKLIDFGIAKAATASNRTRVGMIKGKLAYLSPEQSRSQPLDGRSDIFALGAVLHELLTGTRLFLAENEFETVAAVREKEIPRPSQTREGIPKELDAIVLKALERDLARRYQTAGQLAADLQKVLAKLPPFGPDQLAGLLQRTFAADYEKELKITQALMDAPTIMDPGPAPVAAGNTPGKGVRAAPTPTPVPRQAGLPPRSAAAGKTPPGASRTPPPAKTPPKPTPASGAPDPNVAPRWEDMHDDPTELTGRNAQVIQQAIAAMSKPKLTPQPLPESRPASRPPAPASRAAMPASRPSVAAAAPEPVAQAPTQPLGKARPSYLLWAAVGGFAAAATVAAFVFLGK